MRTPERGGRGPTILLAIVVHPPKCLKDGITVYVFPLPAEEKKPCGGEEAPPGTLVSQVTISVAG